MNGNPHQQSPASRLDTLKKLFAEIDQNRDQVLTFHEFHEFLSKRAGRSFNEELLGEIFRTIDRDKNSTINLTEFASGFTKTETIINQNIESIKSRIAENNENYTNAQRNLVEAKAKKMQGNAENNLYIIIKKAEGLKPGGVTGNKAPAVCIRCEGRETQTTPVPNPTNPEWNQSFTFPVSVGSGDVQIEVFDTERGRRTNFIGEVSVPFAALENQEVCEDWLELRAKQNPDKIQGKILVSVQWIFDLPLYLEKVISEHEHAIREDKAEVESLEKYLKELLGPLKTSQGLPEWFSNNQNIGNVEKAVAGKVGLIYQRTLGNKLKWPKLTMICVYLFVLLSVLAVFHRTDFLNVRHN
jgi:hypothetical protein